MQENDRIREFALDAAQIGVWTISIDGQSVFWDAQTRRIFGVTDGEPITLERAFSVIHPDDRKSAEEAFARAIEPDADGSYYYEKRVIWPDNSIHWILARGKIRTAEPGEPLSVPYLIGTVVDISERKRTEEALQRSEEKYHALFDLINQGFCICEMLVDATGKPYDYRFLEVNQLFEDQTGLKDATGKTALELLPNLEKHWIDIYGRVALTGEPLRFEQGSEVMGRWFDVYAFRFGKPQARQFAIIFNDITERRRAELRGEMLRILASSLSKGMTRQEITEIIIQKGIDGLRAAGGVVALLSDDNTVLEIIGSVGYTPSVIHQWQRIPLDHPTSPLVTAIRDNQRLWMGAAEPGTGIIPAVGTPDYTPGKAWAALPFNINNEVIGVIGLDFNTVKDFDAPEQNFLITLTEYCAQALYRAKLTGQIAALAVAEERQRLSRDLHDSVKQLLFTSSTIAEVIPRVWDTNPDKAKDYAANIVTLNQAALAELQALLNDMRPDVLIATPFMTLLDNLCSTLHGRRAITINVQYDGPEDWHLPPQVHVGLYRIAQEIMHNISKHSEANTVDIDCAAESLKFRLSIHDNGKGFDVKRTSMGMGLNTMHERAQAVGAQLRIHSEPGAGTTVIVEWRFDQSA